MFFFNKQMVRSLAAVFCCACVYAHTCECLFAAYVCTCDMTSMRMLEG